MEFIGSGSFGCVSHPPLCLAKEDDPKADLIGKIALPEYVEPELVAAKGIKSLEENWKPYFGLLTGNSCKAKITSKMIKECEALDDLEPDEIEELRSYTAPYLGVSLDKYKKKITVKYALDSLRHLLRGLNMLHRNKIYHFDVKDRNIVVNESGTMRLIDFGLSMVNPEPKDIQELSFYRIYPLFFNVLFSRNAFGPGTKFSLEEGPLNMYYVVYEHLAEFYYPKYEKGTASDIIANAIYVGSRSKYLENIVMPNLEKVDSYSLALTFNNYLKDQYKKDNIRETKDTERLNLIWEECINSLLYPDVNDQWTTWEALDYLDKNL